jgi:hypothetical protein
MTDRIEGDAIVKCDGGGCNAFGRRRPGHPCPDGWFYLEIADRTAGAPRQIFIVWACSEACKAGAWHAGPGPQILDEDGTERFRARQARKR